ncbi:hypothetical protein LCGC14_0581770 [marine sediment metagenome]|uniref:Uncharacterized protein n=1 Tax=marine sediment metagenome TaxID=412755 RepID=A0A0F9RZX0_9ZZZZ
MAVQEPVPEEERIKTVRLFASAHNGFGDERQGAQDFRYNRNHRGFDPRFPGELRFGDNVTRITYTSSPDSPPMIVIPWREANSNGQEGIMCFTDKGNEFLRRGGFGNLGGSTGNTDAAPHDAGDGIEFLYYVQGTSDGLNKIAIGGGVSGTADSAPWNIDKITSISGQLYASVQQSGSVRWNSIQFVPFGSDPFTSGNWSSVTRVGWPHTDINNIVALRGIPVVLKPEGIYMYNRAIDQWENMTPAWELETHPDNGRAAVALGSNLLVTKGEGGAVVFNGTNEFDVSPYNNNVPGVDTPSQLISCLGLWGTKVIAVTSTARSPIGGSGDKSTHETAWGWGVNSKLIQLGGETNTDLRFWKTTDNESTFTLYTQPRDGSITTGATLNSLDTAANGDYFYIGAPWPWGAAHIEFDEDNTLQNDNAATLAAEYWDGSAWQTMTIVDFTDVAGDTLKKTGMVFLTANPSDWTARTIDTDSVNYYYIRFNVSAALDSTVSVAEVRLLPWRPTIDATLANLGADGRDRQGMIPHILLGELNDKGDFIWQDMGAATVNSGGTEPDVDEIGVVAVGLVGGGDGPAYRKVVCFGRRAAYIHHMNNSQVWVRPPRSGLFEASDFEVADGKAVSLREVRIFGRDFDGVDNFAFYYRYDPNQPWAVVHMGARPPFTKKLTDRGGGTTFQWAIAYTRTSLVPLKRRPAITGIDGVFEILPELADRHVQRTIADSPRG